MNEKQHTTSSLPCTDARQNAVDVSKQTDTSGHAPHDHHHDHGVSGQSRFTLFLYPAISLFLLITGLLLDHYILAEWFSGWMRFAWYLLAYLPVGLPVIREALHSIRYSDFFSEFFLMSIATIGAFSIGEFPEGVAVMLFYSVGEVFQSLAVRKAKGNIQSLLDQRPDEVTVWRGDQAVLARAEEVAIGEHLQVKPGEKVGLDGKLISPKGSFNTSALTGESLPQHKSTGEPVYAGMINLETLTRIEVTAGYADSKLSRILELVQDATTQKAPTELFIRKFAKIYTPIVVYLALGITLLPFFFLDDYQFSVWLYRALIFLVISCPCALVISIPLGYFGGIGACSKQGILVKGSNFLDILAKLRHVVMDKTGTMTEGVFEVQKVALDSSVLPTGKIWSYLNALESHSSHPIATAIQRYVEAPASVPVEEVTEIPGHGLRGVIQGKVLLAGNFKLLDRYGVDYTTDAGSLSDTHLAVAWDNQYIGYITVSDRLKADAKTSITQLHELGVEVTMLSGDRPSVVAEIARELRIDQAFGDLLPEDKVTHFKALKKQYQPIAFMGDGINDAPVVAISDVGIAMGGLGSDATIETADVVIQDDRPSRLPLAIKIGKKTKQIVWQNIGLAFGVKVIVLLLGAGGLASMWEAVFADVGVALLAVLNAVRIQGTKF